MTDANRARQSSKRSRGGGNAATDLRPNGSAQLERRRSAERRGLRAEWLAALWLMLRGYRVLARRVRTPAGEVDLVARRGSAVIAVEVKARVNLDTAVNSVSLRQRYRVARGLESFLQRRPDLLGLDRRFYLVAVRPWRIPTHLVDVWRPPR